MAYPTGFMTSTTLANLIPEVWWNRVNDFFRDKLLFANFFTDRSSELADGGDTLYTPSITEMSSNTKVEWTAVTLNQPTETKITLTVNTWKEVSFLIEDKEIAQVKKSYTIQETYASNAAYTAAKTLETAIGLLFKNFTNTVGASTTAVADSDILKALGIMEATNMDMDMVAFFFDTKVFWNQINSLDKFALSQNSASQDPRTKVPSGSLYGYPVYRSNNIPYQSSTTGRCNVLAHPDAIHYAIANLGGGNVRTQSQYKQEYLGVLWTSDIFFGVALNRATGGVLIRTSAVA